MTIESRARQASAAVHAAVALVEPRRVPARRRFFFSRKFVAIVLAAAAPPGALALVNAAGDGDGRSEHRITDTHVSDVESGRTSASLGRGPGGAGASDRSPRSAGQAMDLTAGRADTSSNGRIVFTSMRDGNAEIYVMDPDGRNVRRLTNSVFDEGWPAWSPDNSQIGFVSNRSGRHEIFTMRPDGSDVRRVGGKDPTYEDVSHLTWSPDGRRLAFNTTSSGPLDYHTIWVIDVDGSGVRRLTSEGDERSPAWSPDGRQLAYWTPTSDPEIRLYDFEGHITLTVGRGAWPAWSPDGSQLVFVDFTNGTDHQRLRTMDRDGANVRTLFETDGEWLGNPSYSPNGDVIVFDRDPDGHDERCLAEWRKNLWSDPAYTACPTGNGPMPSALWQIGSSGSGLRRLSGASSDDYDASYAS